MSCVRIKRSLMRSLRFVSAPGAPISPLAFQVATESFAMPRGKRLQKSPLGSGVIGFLGSCCFAFLQLVVELLGDGLSWDAELF